MAISAIMPPKGFVLDDPNLPEGFVLDKPKPPKGFVLDQPPAIIPQEPPAVAQVIESPELPRVAEPTPTERPVIAPQLPRPEYITTPRDIRPTETPMLTKTSFVQPKLSEHPYPVYGPSDVFFAPPTKLWQEPGARFTKGVGGGWLRATHIPKLIGKEIPLPETKAERAGEVVGQITENITELIGAGLALKGIGLLPKAYSTLSKAAQTGIVFFTQQMSEEARKGTAEAIHDEDFGYRGGIAGLEAFAMGAVLSIAHSATKVGARAIWSKLKPSEQVKALKILGLKKGANLDAINQAARKEAFKYHPDKVSGMRDKFEKVIKARDYLKESARVAKEGIVIAKPKPKLLPGIVPEKAKAEVILPAKPIPEVIEKPPAAPLEAIAPAKPPIPPPVAITPARPPIITPPPVAITPEKPPTVPAEAVTEGQELIGKKVKATVIAEGKTHKVEGKIIDAQIVDGITYIGVEQEPWTPGSALLLQDRWIKEGDFEIIEAAPTPAEPTIEAKPGPTKTLESIRGEGQREPDVLIIKPTSKPTKKIIPAKGRKILRVSLEDKDETITFLDVGGGLGVKGKRLYNLKTQKELAELPSSIAARKAATTLKESGIDFKQPQEDVQKQFDELLKKNNVAQEKEAIIDFLTGRGKELEAEDYIKQFDGGALKGMDYNLERAVDTIGGRLRNFAKEVPEFTLNPTFTFNKESGQLVFKDRYRFGFYPNRLGLNAENLKDGQTIRFDLESFGIKPATTKQIKLTEPFLGEPKILGRTTPEQLKSVEVAKKRVIEKKAREKAELETQIKKAEQEQKKELAKWGLKPNQQVTVTGFQGITEKGQLIDIEKDVMGKPVFMVKLTGARYGSRYQPEHILEVKHFLERKKPVAGAPSKIGFPGIIVGGEMPKAMEPVGKPPISAREIIAHLSKALKVPYANMATHRPRRAAGWYEIRPVGIRQINVRDLDTASHEVGHHIDHYYKIRQAGISKAGRKTWKMPEGTAKGTAVELLKLGKMLYGETKPPGGYKSEGIAEFIRGYLTGHLDIEKEAPNFYKWFTTDYLPNNPEVADGLLNARDMLTDYRLQGAEARIESQINRKQIIGGLKDRAKRINLWFQTMFVDEFAPLRVTMEEVGIEREKLKPSDDPYELAVYFSQKEGARARQMVLFGTIDLYGNKTGKGLKEIMKPIADQNAVRSFTHWIVSARSLNLLKRGIKPGISKADAQYVYDLYKDNPGWKETAQEITKWNQRVLDYLVQAGSLEKQVANRMKELNPVYVPFLRAFAKGEKRFGGGGAGRGLITTKKGVFSIKGSGREIIDPFESMITQTRRMISIAHKSVIARALANLEAKHRGLAGFIWKVPPPKKTTTFRAEQVKKELMKHGVEFPEGGLKEMDALLTVYGNSPIYLGKENIIAIVQNGKKTWYEVSPEMYRLLQGLDKFYLPRFLNVTLGKAGRAVRLGATGINASFGLVRNPIRDSLDTIFKGTHARGPGASIVGVAKDLSRLGLTKSLGINPSKAAQEFVAIGGQISGFIGQDRKSLQHLRGEMLASSVGRYAIHTVSHPIDALRAVFSVAESGPRIQEYEKALIVGERKYGKGSPNAKIYAFNKAQDQTINYSRHGVLGKWLNQMTPFWNANAQDPSKVYRTFRIRGKEATAYAVAFLTLPALGLWWYNKDEEWYKELPAYETANYLHIKVPGKDVILRIPVPFLVGHIFQSTPVVMMDALYRGDPKRIKEHFEQVLKGDIYPLAEWPAIVSPIIDVLQNKDWAGRPIVPRGVEGKLPSDQYKEYTTEFCKIIGKIFNQSPAKIEYLINAWSGGLYRRTGRIAGIITKAPEAIQPADWPVIGAIIVRDPYAPKRSIERFYEEKEHLNRMYQSDRIEPESELDRKRKRYNYISTKYLSLYWEKLQKAKTIVERKQIYGKIGDLIKKAEQTE